MKLRMWLGRRFARLATVAVVRFPWLWRVFRRPLAAEFDALAARWDDIRSPAHLLPLEAALTALEEEPLRVIDIGTGTGAAAEAVARRFPRAEVVGIDLSAGMVAEARRKLSPDLATRVCFETGDSAALPVGDDSFDLAVLLNMIPFFDELARVLAPGGCALFAFSNGAGTPIYVPPERLRHELSQRRFAEFADFSAGNGTALLARKAGGAR